MIYLLLAQTANARVCWVINVSISVLWLWKCTVPSPGKIKYLIGIVIDTYNSRKVNEIRKMLFFK